MAQYGKTQWIQQSLADRGGISPDDPGFGGQADYTPAFLAHVYDPLVLKFANRFVWRLPTGQINELYERQVSAHHLDVGPGTGYLLDHCHFPVAAPDITLLDVNRDVLDAASRTIARYHPRTYQADLLQPLDLPDQSFDSIALTHVLHCLPGTMPEKSVVIDRLRPLLRPGGRLFGTTVLARGVRHTPLSKSLLWFLNRKGVFSNLADDAEQLENSLAANFERYEVWTEGAIAFFVGRA